MRIGTSKVADTISGRHHFEIIEVPDDAVTETLTNHFNLTTATFKSSELTYTNIEQNPILYYQYRMETI